MSYDVVPRTSYFLDFPSFEQGQKEKTFSMQMYKTSIWLLQTRRHVAISSCPRISYGEFWLAEEDTEKLVAVKCSVDAASLTVREWPIGFKRLACYRMAWESESTKLVGGMVYGKVDVRQHSERPRIETVDSWLASLDKAFEL